MWNFVGLMKFVREMGKKIERPALHRVVLCVSIGISVYSMYSVT